MISHRSAPGGSGAGGSAVIITKTLHGNPQGRIFVQGGTPVKCAFGAGGGKVNCYISNTFYSLEFFSQRRRQHDADNNVDNDDADDDHNDNDDDDATTMIPTTTLTTNIKITLTKTATGNRYDSTLSIPTKHFFH